MPRGDDWDDDDDEERPRRRRRRYERERYDDEDEDDYEYDRPLSRGSRDKSGAVTAIGVINIVLGVLVILVSLCVGFFGLVVAGVAADKQFGPNPARGLFGLAGVVALIVAVIVLLFGVGYVISGIGLLNRKGWARMLTLVLAGFTALGALINLIQLIQLVVGGDFPGKPGQIMVQLLFVCLEIGYVVMAFAILLNNRYAAEFR
jgi:hypothetical protein